MMSLQNAWKYCIGFLQYTVSTDIHANEQKETKTYKYLRNFQGQILISFSSLNSKSVGGKKVCDVLSLPRHRQSDTYRDESEVHLRHALRGRHLQLDLELVGGEVEGGRDLAPLQVDREQQLAALARAVRALVRQEIQVLAHEVEALVRLQPETFGSAKRLNELPADVLMSREGTICHVLKADILKCHYTAFRAKGSGDKTNPRLTPPRAAERAGKNICTDEKY